MWTGELQHGCKAVLWSLLLSDIGGNGGVFARAAASGQQQCWPQSVHCCCVFSFFFSGGRGIAFFFLECSSVAGICKNKYVKKNAFAQRVLQGLCLVYTQCVTKLKLLSFHRVCLINVCPFGPGLSLILCYWCCLLNSWKSDIFEITGEILEKLRQSSTSTVVKSRSWSRSRHHQLLTWTNTLKLLPLVNFKVRMQWEGLSRAETRLHWVVWF